MTDIIDLKTHTHQQPHLEDDKADLHHDPNDMNHTGQSQSDVIDLMHHFDIQPTLVIPTWRSQTRMPPQKWSLGLLFVLAWGLIALVFSSMGSVTLPQVGPLYHNLVAYFSDNAPIEPLSALPTIVYGFQIPVVVGLTAILGRRFSTMLIVTFLLLGFAGLPFFANGGGWKYLFEPSAGYLLGFLLVPFLMSNYMERAFRPAQYWLVSYAIFLPLATLTGVLTIHLVGALGLVAQLSLGHATIDDIRQWLTLLTLHPLAYDCLISLVLVSMTRLFRLAGWLAFY